MARLALCLSLVLVLAGCDTIARTYRAVVALPTAQQLILACDGYADTLTVLTAFNNEGRLSDQQVAIVQSVRPFLNEICLDTANVPNFEAALSRVNALMIDLYVMQTRVSADGA